MDAQLVETGLIHNKHRKNMQHTVLVGSPIHLRRIMLNLLSNAIKYNKPGGRIDTYAEELSCDGNTAMYEFRIVDTGIGMSRNLCRTSCSILLHRKRTMPVPGIKVLGLACPL